MMAAPAPTIAELRLSTPVEEAPPNAPPEHQVGPDEVSPDAPGLAAMQGTTGAPTSEMGNETLTAVSKAVEAPQSEVGQAAQDAAANPGTAHAIAATNPGAVGAIANELNVPIPVAAMLLNRQQPRRPVINNPFGQFGDQRVDPAVATGQGCCWIGGCGVG